MTYIDPTITFFSYKHLYVISFCSVTLFFIIIMPSIILLIVYAIRLFEKVKSRLSQRQNLSLLTFVETFQGCYEDGTNGTRDYRAVSGWLLARSEAANHCCPPCYVSCSRYYMVLNSATYFHIIIPLVCLFLSIPHCVFYGYIVYRIGQQLKQSNIDFRAVAREWCMQSGDEEQPQVAD